MADDVKVTEWGESEGGLIIPVKTEVTVLEADTSDRPKVGFMVYETIEDGSVPDYDADVLGSTEEADKYLSTWVVDYEPPDRRGYTVLPVLQGFWGKPWDQCALNHVHSLRPGGIRVTNSGIKLDAQTWRVTVYLEDDDRTIRKIEQEVEVGCVGAKHGHGLSKYVRGETPTPALGYYNPRGLKRLEISLDRCEITYQPSGTCREHLPQDPEDWCSTCAGDAGKVYPAPEEESE
jgi:hypothetical protein